MSSSGFLATAVRSKSMVDLVPQRPHAPPLDPAHLGVELAFETVVDRDDSTKWVHLNCRDSACDNLARRETSANWIICEEVSGCTPGRTRPSIVPTVRTQSAPHTQPASRATRLPESACRCASTAPTIAELTARNRLLAAPLRSASGCRPASGRRAAPACRVANSPTGHAYWFSSLGHREVPSVVSWQW